MDLGIEVIQHANVEALLEQRVNEVRTDETGPTSD
jgi:hypothetical protein